MNNPKAREKVLDMCAEFNLVDVCRLFNNDKAEYTWRTKTCSKQARLYFILVSENLRGCRQGDPLSPYIFVICAEILAILICQNDKIRGINIDGKEFLISQYADDTSLTLDGSHESLCRTLQILKFYAEASGLHVNLDKTRLIWFGSMKNSPLRLCTDVNLCWDQGVFVNLGITFSVDLTTMVNLNYENKFREIKDWTNALFIVHKRYMLCITNTQIYTVCRRYKFLLFRL